MCNVMSIVLNIGRLFQYLLLCSIIRQIHSKSIRKYDECEQFYVTHDCYYFPCLDAHYSCGRDNHLARFSYDLCLLTRRKYSSRLTTNGRFYFNHTNQCAMASLHAQLVEERIAATFTCTDLQTMVFDIYTKCFQSTQPENQMATVIDFCSIVCENLQVLIDLFLNLTGIYINLHRLLKETGEACGAKITDRAVLTMPSLLISICLDRKDAHIKDDITSIMFNQRFEPSEYEWI